MSVYYAINTTLGIGGCVEEVDILERVWRESGEGSVRPMHTMVSKLRRKLGDDARNPIYIFTEPRVGFRMPKGEGPPAVR